MIDEELVQAADLLGKQAFFIPGIGALVMTIQSPLGLLLLVVLPTIGYFAIGIFGRKEDEVSVEGN